MKKLSIDEIRRIELDILIEFAGFCRKHDLIFYLSGGTLLGAIRHKGFIPWDDDIDVCMPRKHYEFFVRNFVCSNKFFKVYSYSLGNFSAPFTKIIDCQTRVFSKYGDALPEMGLWIDVFPVDGLPDDINEVKKIYEVCNFYRTVYGIANARLGEGKTGFRKYIKYLLKPIANIYGKEKCSEKIEHLARCYPYEECAYVGAITWGLYGEGERMVKNEFEHAIEVSFEGHQFPAFSCWDSYLTGLYGDYMKLPPVEARKTHDMEVYGSIGI